MCPTVEVIRNGYSIFDSESKVMKANCTSSLIRDEGVILVVDTLTAWDRCLLIESLKEKCTNVEDITHVVCTHGHSDHVGNLNLFINAQHIVGQSISYKDEYTYHTFEEGNPYRISENIEVIATPGHTLSDVSVIVKKTSLNTVAVVGDLFEREEDIGNPNLWKNIAGSENPELQYTNRKKILQIADFIIPGHGPGFKVTEELKNLHAKLGEINDIQ